MRTSPATLATLVRLRERELDEAREHLAECLAREASAAESAREADRTIRREQEAASALDASDAAVETFAAWLPLGREAVAAAATARARAEGATVQARAKLAAARGAAEAAVKLRDAARAEVASRRERRLQADLEEVGRRLQDD